MTTKTELRHPFGELLAQYRARKPGLTQTRLAELAGYDQAILVRMAQGKKDLTGPSGRERVVRLTETLADQGALTTLDEANALLLSADMPPLFERNHNEARLMTRLSRLPVGQRVRRTNLPAPLTSFVGRAQEIAEVRRLLGLTRLLTLTGAGGCGKTRLAQRIAADVLITYSEGVWYAELVALSDPALIPDVVARALGLIAADRPAQEQVLDYLRERQVLLVLDNCEHLIDAVATFSIEVLRACPRVTILTTSREALNVEGEMTWRVPPMQPDEAGRLFVDRAAAARSDAPLSAQDQTVTHICQRLDGMPLAIELAAARLSALSLSDIAARLDDRFNLLAGGRRGALPRHQTLRALIDWSYDSLSEPEKVVFRRLGVFVGGWALEQAEQVIGDNIFEEDSVLTILTQLVGKSLVVVDDYTGGTRYRMLETMREYALEKLSDYDELHRTRASHAHAYLTLAEQAVIPIRGREQAYWLRQLREEQGNWRTALEWSFGAKGDAVIGCRFVWGLTLFWWFATEFLTEARRWVQAAKQTIDTNTPPEIEANILVALIGFEIAEFDTLRSYNERALSLYESLGNQAGIAFTKNLKGRGLITEIATVKEGMQLIKQSITLANAIGDPWIEQIGLESLALHELALHQDLDRSEALFQEVLSINKRIGNNNGVANTLKHLGILMMEQMHFVEGLRYAEQMLHVARLMDHPLGEVDALCLVGEALRFLGKLDEALPFFEESMSVARIRLSDVDGLGAMMSLAKAINDTGDTERAWALLVEMVHTRRRYMPDGLVGVTEIDAMGCVISNRGSYEVAMRLFGASDAWLKANKTRHSLINDREYAPYIAKARAALGEEAYEAAYAEGRAMTLEQAIAYALNE